jgi:putative membrane protein
MKTQTFVLMCAVTLGVTATAAGQPPRPDPAAPNPVPPIARESTQETPSRGGDQAFAQKAAAGGAAEVELAQLAMEKASSDAVKQLASRIQSDHSKANQQLASIGSSKGWQLPSSPAAEHQATKSKLEKLSGADFDRAYVEAMVKDHRKDIREFEREASNGADDAVKQFASSTLPTLKQHLEMAESAHQSLAGKSGSKTSREQEPSAQQPH